MLIGKGIAKLEIILKEDIIRSSRNERKICKFLSESRLRLHELISSRFNTGSKVAKVEHTYGRRDNRIIKIFRVNAPRRMIQIQRRDHSDGIWCRWRGVGGLDDKGSFASISLARLCIKSRVTQMREKEISHDSDSCAVSRNESISRDLCIVFTRSRGWKKKKKVTPRLNYKPHVAFETARPENERILVVCDIRCG